MLHVDLWHFPKPLFILDKGTSHSVLNLLNKVGWETEESCAWSGICLQRALSDLVHCCDAASTNQHLTGSLSLRTS
jgi:hypothetical protein